MQATGNNSFQTYSLSIRLHADGFSFYGYSAQNLRPLLAENYPVSDKEAYIATLEDALKRSAIMRKPSNMVSCIITGDAIDVPLDCFKKEEAAALYRLTYAKDTNERMHYNILPHLEIAKVFTLPKDLESTLTRHFPALRFYHMETMLQEKLLLHHLPNEGTLYIYFHEDSFRIFHFKGGKLNYSNHFHADKVENMVYFILSVWKDLKLDQQKDMCLIMGNHPQRKDSAELLRKFIHHVKEANISEIFPEREAMKETSLPLDVLTLYI